MFRYDLRELLHSRQLPELFRNLSPQHQRRPDRALPPARPAPSAETAARRAHRSTGATCVRNTSEALSSRKPCAGQLVLQLGQGLRCVPPASAPGRQPAPCAAPPVSPASSWPSATSSIFMKLRSEVALLTGLDRPPLAPQAADRPVHEAHAGGAVGARVRSLAHQHVAHLRRSGKAKAANRRCSGGQVVVGRQRRQVGRIGARHRGQSLRAGADARTDGRATARREWKAGMAEIMGAIVARSQPCVSDSLQLRA